MAGSSRPIAPQLRELNVAFLRLFILKTAAPTERAPEPCCKLRASEGMA